MAISTNSIIHYTDTADKLKGILREGFRVKYCGEILKMEKEVSSRAAHPMISFCDIPLSHSNEHFGAYGYYGIGLTKEWAKENGANPVLYLDDNSSIAKTLGYFLKERRKSNSNLNEEQKSQLLRFKSFAKNYSGALKRKNISIRNYKFYNEREWRIVPEKDILNGESFSVTLSTYENNKANYNERLSGIRYTFKPQDISYIIVAETSEIPDFIDTLRNTFKKECTSEELDILFSKICSTEQIIADY